MNIEILFENLVANESLRQRVERRTEYGFGSLRNRIKAVRVNLGRVSEPRDGKDKSCRVRILLFDGQEIRLEILDPDLHIAVHRAIDRASWTVARRLQRNRRQAIESRAAVKNPIDTAEPERAA